MTNVGKLNNMTFKELILSIHRWFKYLCSKWLAILIAILIGGGVGFVISFLSPKYYIAETNVALEGASTNTGIGAAFGFGGEQTGGLFSSTDNIVWLYTNGTMIREALLSKVESSKGKRERLINYLIRTSASIKELTKDMEIYKNIHFSLEDSTFSLHQEKFIKSCVSLIKADYIEANAVEKTENVVSVKISAEDEDFAFQFCNGLVKVVNDFYVKSKSRKSQLNVDRLAIKADSFKRSMSAKMVSTAVSIERVPYANPNLNTLQVDAQRGNVEVQSATALYMQIVQSLEAAKNELAKETPVVQVVDMPIKPLRVDKIRLSVAVGVGLFLAAFAICSVLILSKSYKDMMYNPNSSDSKI